MKNRITANLTLLLLAFLASSITHAEEGIKPALIEYDVEIIIFEDAHARYINSEYWHEETELIPPEAISTGLVTDNDFKKNNFITTKPTILDTEYRRVNNSSEYNVLFYGSWRQTGLDENKTFDINIEELNNTHNSSSENRITGNFKLVLGRYLHIYADLEYHRDEEKATTEITGNTYKAETELENTVDSPVLKELPYSIDIHRRMRSKELHYIDHPLVGMLIQINPVKTSAEEKTEN